MLLLRSRVDDGRRAGARAHPGCHWKQTRFYTSSLAELRERMWKLGLVVEQHLSVRPVRTIPHQSDSVKGVLATPVRLRYVRRENSMTAQPDFRICPL
ncbi:MAG TPA: hypothetical protein VE224_12705, partial [Pseudolabrys sp.]|nr:hypothetical protein [Pseudolabrys sp.]